jgi:hypothetical protein
MAAERAARLTALGLDCVSHGTCEDCKLKRPFFGMKPDGKKRWCGGCAEAHAGEGNFARVCEGCLLKVPTFGLPSDGKTPRWCSDCAKAHEGAMNVTHKKCEGCQLKLPLYGLVSEGKKRWCGGCAKAHTGAVGLHDMKCKGCGLKVARLGLPSDWKERRRCADCARVLIAPRGAASRRCDPPKLRMPIKNSSANGAKRNSEFWSKDEDDLLRTTVAGHGGANWKVRVSYSTY